MAGDKVIIIDVSQLYKATGKAKLVALPEYETEALNMTGSGNVVKLTGPGPVWLYLRLAHALHGRARKLIYDSPVTGEVVIFDHDPY
ncbi:MAG: CRISPR-associated protein Csx3 [Peptococcaceae bacterium]|nr:CRISPR-associated protein Csx3 [Peptococcaceae bacterium]